MAHKSLILAYSCDVNQIRNQRARGCPVVATIVIDLAEWDCCVPRTHRAVTIEHRVPRWATCDGKRVMQPHVVGVKAACVFPPVVGEGPLYGSTREARLAQSLQRLIHPFAEIHLVK